jgi:hypothetical protein
VSSQKLPPWSEIKGGLQHLDQKEMIKLIRDLYQLSKENRIFLTSRMGICDQEPLLEPYKRAIRREFYPDRGLPRLNLAAARKALNDFKRINPQLETVAELLVYFVEQGVACTREYGDIHAQFYSSLESAFVEAITLIRESEDEQIIEKFRPRLREIVADTVNIGWGFHDYLQDVFYNEYPEEQEEAKS